MRPFNRTFYSLGFIVFFFLSFPSFLLLYRATRQMASLKGKEGSRDFFAAATQLMLSKVRGRWV